MRNSVTLKSIMNTIKKIDTYHVPVLLEACMEGMDLKPDGTYVDVTFGGGGHSREILKHLSSEGHLYSFDQDADAEQNIPGTDERFTFVRSNFRYLNNWMRYHEVEGVDALLADLGVSSHHFDAEERGFSFRFEAPLDMRMNGRGGMTAADVVNKYTEAQLADVFYLYGELKNARKLAAAIVKARTQQSLTQIQDLLDVVKPLMPRDREKKDLAKVFQALRIEVNHEMDALREMLEAALRNLKVGGRLVVLTYHSLEDRLVKNFMRAGNFEGNVEQDFFGNRKAPMKPLGKVIVPDQEEQQRNPRSRSAKLRIAEKL
jgi:16S rRNA (cytosine1402-N4)-methyltransferase